MHCAFHGHAGMLYTSHALASDEPCGCTCGEKCPPPTCIHADKEVHCSPVGLVYMTLPTVMLQVPGCLSGELLME